MMEYDAIMFLFIAIVSIWSAINVLTSKEIVHSLIYLATLFMSVAALYVVLSSEYIALIQLLVYVGAITVVITFGIMLTKRTSESAMLDDICDDIERELGDE